MRLISLGISGFRAFSGDYRFELDGDVLLIVGSNGQGKTSLLDAIHWGLTGQVSRLNQQSSVVSLYSFTGETRVEIEIGSDDGRRIVARRHFDGQQSRLTLETDTKTFIGDEAQFELIRCLWPEGLAATDPSNALRTSLERAVYLQQDVVTGFLTADTDQDRFNAVSELIGSGHATEFQHALERSRVAWSRTTNQQARNLKETEVRHARLLSQLQEITEDYAMSPVSFSDWEAWWKEVERLGVTVHVPERPESSDASNAIDAAMSELRALRHSRERRDQRLGEFANDLRDIPTNVPDVNALKKILDQVKGELDEARSKLKQAEVSVANLRKRQSEMKTTDQELRILFDVALRHLEELCPVCQQTYDREATRQRLVNRLAEPEHNETAQERIPVLGQLVSIVQEKEREVSSALEALRNAERLEMMSAQRLSRIRGGLLEFGIDISVTERLPESLHGALEENEHTLRAIAKSMANGENIAFSLARVGQLARRMELERETVVVGQELDKLRPEVKARQESGEFATRMIDNLREISSILVKQELARIDPLLQRIYASADPHPEFRVVRLLSRMYGGHGRLTAEVGDVFGDQKSDAPEEYLSSSQLNVLAVSVFLALNLGMRSLPLRTVILDDPLQSLDDLNLLGLIDLLKRIREHRQLMISTHDVRFASLLRRKLRPVSESHRTLLIGLNGWDRQGPVVAQSEVDRDPVPIRIANTA